MKITKPILAAVCLLTACLGRADTHTITTPEGAFAFTVDGGPDQNPTINLVAGVANILQIDTADFHPVVIVNSLDMFDWYSGADPQDVNSDNITITTPATGFPTVLYYMCYIHGFYGEIDISAPVSPIPPANTILQIRVGTNIVMTSTGTNTTWNLVPEFSSNLFLGGGLWAPVPAYSNTFSNGTNTTVFDRLDPICGPNVFLRVRQTQN